MKICNLIICFVVFFLSGIIACKKEKVEKLNPDIEYHKTDETLKSFYPQPTAMDRFEYVGYLVFDEKGIGVSVVISWESDPDCIEFYVNNTNGETLNENGYTKAMNAGVSIDNASQSWNVYSSISNDYVANPGLPKGNLAGKGDKYVGFRVFEGGNPNNKYYGWAKINVSDNGRTVKVYEYAFRKTPNTAIKTGEK